MLVYKSYFSIILLYLGTSEAVKAKGRIIHGKYFGPLNETTTFPKEVSVHEIEIGSFNQPLDHFNASDIRTWKQKYARNNTFFKIGNPACIFIGGESPMDPRWVVTSQIVTYCRQLNGVIYALEHRFYGESRPLNDATVESLKYLSIAQALRDISRFIEFVRFNELHRVGKIILFGGSYAGSLVTYFRHKFPTFVDISVSSSAPISWRYDFKEYLEVVGRVMRNHSGECYDKVKSGMRQLETKIFEAMDSSLQKPINEILAPLKLCGNFYVTNPLEVENFFSEISGVFSHYTQYNGVDLLIMSMREVCEQMTPKLLEPRTDFEILADLLNLMRSYLQHDCLDFSHDNFCNYISKTEWEDDAVSSGGRMWIWQVCNEVASFQTSNSNSQPFTGLSTALFVSQCQCAFGHKYTEKFIQHAVNRHVELYGGINVGRPRVIYTNGEYDPWAEMGVKTALQIHDEQLHPHNTNCVILIKDASHCNDILAERPTIDSIYLQQARNATLRCIRNWLK